MTLSATRFDRIRSVISPQPKRASRAGHRVVLRVRRPYPGLPSGGTRRRNRLGEDRQRIRVLANDGSPDVAIRSTPLRGRNDPKLAALERVDQDRPPRVRGRMCRARKRSTERRVSEIELCYAHDRICDAILTLRRSVACQPAAAATKSRTRDPDTARRRPELVLCRPPVEATRAPASEAEAGARHQPLPMLATPPPRPPHRPAPAGRRASTCQSKLDNTPLPKDAR